ncbi:MAG: hemerythrin domain-containing protein [Burkholderiaceae bacterium]|nr:hemerythrin domain-containing protein [Burkholderiaceae bacterium]
MLNTQIYRNDHVALGAMIADFESRLVISKLQADPAECRKLLSNLIGKLRIHISSEDQLLYPQAASSSNPAIRALAQRFQSEMGPLAIQLKQYSERWLLPRDIAARPTDFMNESNGIVRALKERIRRENNEFYSMLEKSAQ